MSVLLFWPRIRRALLASLSLVNVSLSCLHSVHFVSLHSPSQYLSCPHSSNPCNPFLGILDFGGIWQCLACSPSTLSIVSLHSSNPFLWGLGFWGDLVNVLPCLRSIHFVSLHSPSNYLRSNAKKEVFLLHTSNPLFLRLCNFFPLLRTGPVWSLLMLPKSFFCIGFVIQSTSKYWKDSIFIMST